MTKSKIEFIEELMGYFTDPFLPEDHVRVHRVDDIYDVPALSIHIGRRDVIITEDEVIAAGTDLTRLEE